MQAGTGAWIAGGLALGALGALAAVAWWRSGRPERVALVGDSLAAGLTAPLGKLAAAGGVPFRADGHVGTTPLQWSQQAAACAPCGAWIPGWAPSIVLVVLGTNDLGYSPSPPAGPYQQLVARWSSVAEVVWVQVIGSLGCKVIPAMAGLSFGADNIHPSNYGPWAAFIWGHL